MYIRFHKWKQEVHHILPNPAPQAATCVATSSGIAPLVRAGSVAGLLFGFSFSARVWWLSLSSRSLERLGDVTNGVFGSIWRLPPRTEECQIDVRHSLFV